MNNDIAVACVYVSCVTTLRPEFSVVHLISGIGGSELANVVLGVPGNSIVNGIPWFPGTSTFLAEIQSDDRNCYVRTFFGCIYKMYCLWCRSWVKTSMLKVIRWCRWRRRTWMLHHKRGKFDSCSSRGQHFSARIRSDQTVSDFLLYLPKDGGKCLQCSNFINLTPDSQLNRDFQ